ncbi:uncharacterized protein FIBRA_09587 [Fibroporia radiculosa]|uniref:Uncharacterized protein n=1 Tax=Fibroporia radiculosa TaxID=599839 RepID=J7SCJ5_9APHY|nr:uncharacterized protein FIBRA_09587 [Fibroporia radiculosa]CCM07241.1 predicted protein [Fibroporia radiculosa]
MTIDLIFGTEAKTLFLQIGGLETCATLTHLLFYMKEFSPYRSLCC